MSPISQKSISGITSITTPAGIDNQFTIHTNNTSEALKLDHAGNIHIHNHVNTTGISSASNFKTGSSNLHSSGLSAASIDVGNNIKLGNAGVITATSFVGDGSDLTNLPAGLGTALSATATSPLNKMYYTNAVLGIAATTTVDVPASASAAYTQYADINIATDADLIIAEGDDLIPDVLGLADFGTFGGGTAGRLRVSSISNHTANGAPTVQHGLVITGVTTSTTFSGSGASLTNLPAAQLSGTAAAINGSNITNLNASNIASGTVPTARLGSGTANSSTFLRGDSTFAAVTSTTINSNADNRIITGSGTANTLNGESNLTFDGTNLLLGTTDGKIQLKDGNNYIQFVNADKNFKFMNAWGAGEFTFHVNGGERLRITSAGNVGINQNNPARQLHIVGNDGATGASPGNSDTAFIIDNQGTNGAIMEFLSNNNGNGYIFFTDTDASNRGAIRYKHSEDFLAFHTAGTERLRINSNGQVTQSAQPSFAVNVSSNAYTVNNGVLPFNATRHNTGSHFNTSNYRFTAPVAGRYLFTFHSIVNGSVNSGQQHYDIRINNSVSRGMSSHFSNLANNNWDQVSSSYIFELSANDYVQMYSVSNTGWHGNDWQLFCGQLLS